MGKMSEAFSKLENYVREVGGDISVRYGTILVPEEEFSTVHKILRDAGIVDFRVEDSEKFFVCGECGEVRVKGLDDCFLKHGSSVCANCLNSKFEKLRNLIRLDGVEFNNCPRTLRWRIEEYATKEFDFSMANFMKDNEEIEEKLACLNEETGGFFLLYDYDSTMCDVYTLKEAQRETAY